MLKKLLALLFAVLVVATAGGAWFWQQYQNYLQHPLPWSTQTRVLSIPSGMTVNRLADYLASQQLPVDAQFLKLYAYLHPEHTQIKVGEYVLPVELRLPELLQLLVAGKSRQYSITLLEGWTFKQMLHAIEAHPQLKHELKGLSGTAIMARLGYAGEHPEGRFFPDTYWFPKGYSDVALLQQAYQRMQRILTREWNARAPGLPLKTPYQALILASIVEKETGLPEERAKIAGVFIRRLQKGMRLQTDPTVIYGMGEAYQGNLRKKDLRQETPYNTYVIKGLPPTPICMPGEAAIRAALHPEQGKALYFVAKGDGSHQFSETLRQHNNAVRKYQLKK